MVSYLFADITEKIIGAAYVVHNSLGKGLSEKAYENALAEQLRSLGLSVDQQQDISVFFGSKKVAEQRVDLVVENKIVVELKTVEKLGDSHMTQLLSYLRNTKFQLGLLLNFSKKVEVKRLILTNQKR